MESGIYIIRNIVDGKIYIGSAANLDRRLKMHIWLLRNKKHINRHLQQAWNKYREISFVAEIYLTCEKKDLIFNEQLVIDASIIRYGRENIYNICLVAGSTLGRKHSEATKIKIGITSKGRWTGRHHTEETKEKIRLNNIGKNKGKVASIETRKRMSENRKGKKFTEEHKFNLSKALKKVWKKKERI